MRQEKSDIGHNTEIKQIQTKGKYALLNDFVLEKSIFNNIFEKDIRRVYIYKKAERLAKAIHLITPAFINSTSLRSRIEAIALGLVDAAIQAPSVARVALSRELLTLSSVLSIAQASDILSPMNAELIGHEAHAFLEEVALYEEPRLFLDEVSTLSDIAKRVARQDVSQRYNVETIGHTISAYATSGGPASAGKGHKKDILSVTDIHIKDRRNAILSVIRNKKKASIKDISTVIRTVSEKTIQRELLSLISAGTVLKEGERRWSVYSLA